MNAMDKARRREQLIRELRIKLLTGETSASGDALEKALVKVLKNHKKKQNETSA